MFFFFLVCADSMTQQLAHAPASMRWFVGSVFLATVVVFNWTRYETERDGRPHQFPPLTDPVPGVFEFVAQNSAPTDKILTTGPPGLYMHVNRLSAVRESSFLDEFLLYYQGNNDVEKVAHIRAQLVKNRPKIVIVDPEHGDRKRRHMAALVTPFLTEFNYKQAGTYFYLRPD
jgi:hypothetical protein